MGIGNCSGCSSAVCAWIYRVKGELPPCPLSARAHLHHLLLDYGLICADSLLVNLLLCNMSEHRESLLIPISPLSDSHQEAASHSEERNVVAGKVLEGAPTTERSSSADCWTPGALLQCLRRPHCCAHLPSSHCSDQLRDLQGSKGSQLITPAPLHIERRTL